MLFVDTNPALDAFWNLYAKLVYEKYYYDEFRRMSIFYDKIFTWGCLATSSIAVASWGIWNHLAPVWAAIVGLSQIANLLKPLLHFTEQICMTGLALPELQRVVSEMGIVGIPTTEVTHLM